jgi:hypothetical protein
MDENARLDMAYRYPFSKAAKEVVATQPNQVVRKYLDRAKEHIDQAVNTGLTYTDVRLSFSKLDYVMTYLYSRMVLSALKDKNLIRTYAKAEGARSAEAADSKGVDELIRVSNELDLAIGRRFGSKADAGEFAIRFEKYILNAPYKKEYELVNQKLGGGAVILKEKGMKGLLAEAARREIMKGLPIKANELPTEVTEYCKGVKIKIKGSEDASSKKSLASEGWIEQLLKTPIPDVRHRTVNLILAPYLVNSKGLEVEQAVKIIVEYIERCKEIEPNTKVNERYIEYQCSYAKRRGLKPLSRDKARELLQGSIDL